MSLLEMKDIVKEFPGVRALDGVSFTLEASEFHSLVGENGAGKSTLMKVLSGVYPVGTYDGEILIDDQLQQFRGVRDSENAGVAIIFQELSLVKELTVGENIFLGQEPAKFGVIDWSELYHRATKLLKDLHLPIDPRLPVGSLGIGQQQLVEIAKALSKKARILVLDEPTAALTESEVETLFVILRKLKASGVGMIYISHKLDEVFEMSDRITVLRDGRTVATHAAAELNKEKVIQLMVGREVGDIFPKVDHELGETALEVRNLTVYSTDDPTKKLVSDVSFSVRKGEVLGVAGLILEQTIMDNMTLAGLREISGRVVTNRSRELMATRAPMASLRIKANSPLTIAGTLSGGNQQKVVLGKWLLTGPKVLFLDEPTRGIDVGAKQEIYAEINKLAREGLAIVLVSSELPEVLGLSDRVLVLHEGRVTGEFTRKEATPEKVMTAATGHTTNGNQTEQG